MIPTPATEALIGTKVALICAAVLSLCAFMLYQQPHDIGHEWKLPVRTALLLLSAACAAQNAALSFVSLGVGGSSLSSSVQGGAYFVFVLFLLTAIILIAGFGYSVFETASRAKAAAEGATTPEHTAPTNREDSETGVVVNVEAAKPAPAGGDDADPQVA